MDSSAWRTRLEGKWGKVRLSFPANPVLPSPEAEWAAAAFRPRSAFEVVSWDVISPEWEGAAHAPWNIPVRVGDDFVPGGLAREFPFWRDVLLTDHPERNTILTWVKDGVSDYELLLPDARGVSVEQPFNPAAFPGEEMPHRVPEEFHEFVTREVATLVSRGCLVPFEEVRTSEGLARPIIVMPLSVEPSKPRLIYDARRLNATYRHVCFPWIKWVRLPPWGGRVAIKVHSMTSQVSIISCYTQHRGPCLGRFGRELRMYGWCCRSAGTRARLCTKPSPGCEAAVLAVSRYSGGYLYRRRVAVLPGSS